MKSLIIKSKSLLVIMAVVLSFGFFAGNVFADTLNSIAITSPATKLTYMVGESLDITGLVVTGSYLVGRDVLPRLETVTTGDISGFNSSAPVVGQVLTITIGGKTTTYTIDVVAPIVYTLTYSAGENGTLTGSTTQSVIENTDGTSVTAVANSGFIFVDWSDASTTNPRTDSNVQGNVTVTANFIENTVSGGGGNGSRGGGNTTPNVATPDTEGEVLGASTFAFNTDLRLGMSGNDVKELQERLRAEGFFTYETSTGYFGEITLAAVKAYQAAHPEIGYVTGFVGPLTRAILNK